MLRVETADDALKLGKFLDQLGRKIGLGQQRSLEHNPRPDRRAAVADQFRHQAAELLHPASLVVVTAEIFLEGHRLQHVDALSQADFLVSLPEETGVVEAGAQYPFIAVTNETVRIAVGIQHREKMWQQLAAFVFQREVLLVIAHHGHQHFRGKREEFRLEIS